MVNKSNTAFQSAAYRLKKELGVSGMRFTERDLSFFSDLAKIGVISSEQISKYHYQKNSKPLARIEKLVEVGLLKRHVTYHEKHGKTTAYVFNDQRVARVFDGFTPKIGNRTLRHEILVSEAYFSSGRPSNFKIASRFDERLYRKFNCHFELGVRKPEYVRAMESVLPDAIFTNSNGEMVVVEADAGSYNRDEVKRKTAGWSEHKQLWVQDEGARAKVSEGVNVKVLRV